MGKLTAKAVEKAAPLHIQGSKVGSKDGWYIIYHDVVPCGAFGDWRGGQSIKWCFKKQKQMSKKERGRFNRSL